MMTRTTRTAPVTSTTTATLSVEVRDAADIRLPPITYTTLRVGFRHGGRDMTAVRFHRTDTGCRGVEIYFGAEDSWGQEFARYAREAGGTAMDRAAIAAINRGTYELAVAAAGPNPGAPERFAAIELQ